MFKNRQLKNEEDGLESNNPIYIYEKLIHMNLLQKQYLNGNNLNVLSLFLYFDPIYDKMEILLL